ncbi:DUF2490 domain-containing protein [Pedobacter montanisoli]|uniref:DUF2490 domain-containing protein n=1 Tax=Pedobacter montanisoli TaxID=2923277 RepID=A0ABS9ZUB6_9SPHI|nr:DUF2490 domain-containing protein [Pedobacter montanisoli]MCJ0742196.1 DUF2490 domain-containing protein [Pedobacter montanisoli]
MKKLLLFLILSLVTLCGFAQTVNQHAGWLMFLNSTKINDKWSLHFDFQMQSADNWEYVRRILVRPGITYSINKNQRVTAGYLYNPTYSRVIGASNSTLTENTIWEQYLITHKFQAAAVTHRFRLEQRFMERSNADDFFMQRFRYFFRVLQPLSKNKGAFNQGIYAALQDEVFFNVQHKEQVNGRLFDQNRVFLALGYRISPKVDVEAGYLNQYIKGSSNVTYNHVAQLSINTRF